MPTSALQFHFARSNHFPMAMLEALGQILVDFDLALFCLEPSAWLWAFICASALYPNEIVPLGCGFPSAAPGVLPSPRALFLFFGWHLPCGLAVRPGLFGVTLLAFWAVLDAVVACWGGVFGPMLGHCLGPPLICNFEWLGCVGP